MKALCRGFTLIELLIVIAIIGLLSTMAVAGLHRTQKKLAIPKDWQTLSKFIKP